MEVLALRDFGAAYEGRRVLVTGHTGFKGSWLCLWLKALGADVVGVALDPPSEPSHWDLLALDITEHRIDVRDEAAVRSVFARERPEVVFHLAAQSLVRRSYAEPVSTWSTNVMGTAVVLDAIRHTPDTRAAVVVTSDKCYDNRELPRAFLESDRLGGHDPYSASKAAAELVVASYRLAFAQDGRPLLATARGGNVIGGGDFSEDRLIPDLVRSATAGEPLIVRSPGSTRPWQHVLDCLSGYLLLGQRLLAGDPTVADAWNFGPDPRATRTVEAVLDELGGSWPQMRWVVDATPRLHEARILQVDSSKAATRLRWRPVWTFETAVRHTAEWYRHWLDRGEVSSSEQLDRFVADAASAHLEWASTPN